MITIGKSIRHKWVENLALKHLSMVSRHCHFILQQYWKGFDRKSKNMTGWKVIPSYEIDILIALLSMSLSLALASKLPIDKLF